MNRDNGPAANIITATAAITATNMIGMCSVMPTAVTMLSMENTRSSTRICPMADHGVSVAVFTSAPFVVAVSCAT